jgi:hypothetical protein
MLWTTRGSFDWSLRRGWQQNGRPSGSNMRNRCGSGMLKGSWCRLEGGEKASPENHHLKQIYQWIPDIQTFLRSFWKVWNLWRNLQNLWTGACAVEYVHCPKPVPPVLPGSDSPLLLLVYLFGLNSNLVYGLRISSLMKIECLHSTNTNNQVDPPIWQKQARIDISR